MRFTTFVLGIALVHMCSAAYSQITLKERNVPLEKVLAAIEQQTKYVFLYDPYDLKTDPININMTNATLQETLGKIFKGLPIDFTVVGNNVLLKPRRPENIKNIPDITLSGILSDLDAAMQGLPPLNSAICYA